MSDAMFDTVESAEETSFPITGVGDESSWIVVVVKPAISVEISDAMLDTVESAVLSSSSMNVVPFSSSPTSPSSEAILELLTGLISDPMSSVVVLM